MNPERIFQRLWALTHLSPAEAPIQSAHFHAHALYSLLWTLVLPRSLWSVGPLASCIWMLLAELGPSGRTVDLVFRGLGVLAGALVSWWISR